MIKNMICPFYGSKWRIAKWIETHFPSHTTFCDVFGGSGVMTLRKKKSPVEVYNDISFKMFNLIRNIKENHEEMLGYLSKLNYSKEIYLEHFGATPTNQQVPDYVLQYANKIMLVASWSYGSQGAHRKYPDFQQDFEYRSSLKVWKNRLVDLPNKAKRLKDVILENMDFEEIIKKYDNPMTLFFCDPPYLGSEDGYSKRKDNVFNERNHRKLTECLHSIKGMALICGYHSPLYAKMYRDWRFVTKANKALQNKSSIEYLWISPKADLDFRLKTLKGNSIGN